MPHAHPTPAQQFRCQSDLDVMSILQVRHVISGPGEFGAALFTGGEPAGRRHFSLPIDFARSNRIGGNSLTIVRSKGRADPINQCIGYNGKSSRKIEANLLQRVGLVKKKSGHHTQGFEALPGARNYGSCAKASPACFATRPESSACRRCPGARVGRVVELMLTQLTGRGHALGPPRDGRGHPARRCAR